MRKVLVIAMLMAFVTGLCAEEKKCETQACETTWTQWFGGAAALAMAYQHASSKLPWLENFNMVALSKAAEHGSALSLWAMNKWKGSDKKE